MYQSDPATMTSTRQPGPKGPSSLRQWAGRPVGDKSLVRAIFHYLLRLFFITSTEFKNVQLSLRASALTYTILLSLVPMLAMSTAAVKGFGGGDHLRKAAYSYIESLEGNAGLHLTGATIDSAADMAGPEKTKSDITGHLRSAVDKLFDYVDKTNFATLGTIGVVGMLLTVLMMLGHIESAMNAIWKVSAARSIFRKVADYLTLMILLPISMNFAFAAIAFLKSPVLALQMDRLIPVDWLQSLLLKPIPILFIALTLFVMYLFFPNTRVKTLPAMAGAFVAALLWFTAQNLYITLQLGVANYNAIYGSFATLPLFFIWVYLSWIFILTGAQLAYAFQNVKTYRLLPYSGFPSLRLAAAFDLMDHLHRAFAAQQPLQAANLSDSLSCYPQPIIEEALKALVTMEAVYVSPADDRLLPTCPPEKLDRQRVVEVILGTEAPDTLGGRLSLEAIKTAGRCSAGQTK